MHPEAPLTEGRMCVLENAKGTFLCILLGMVLVLSFDYSEASPELRRPDRTKHMQRTKSLHRYPRKTENDPVPYFDNNTARNITTTSGKTAYLPCRVRHLGDRTVSWIRRVDLHVLTVGRFTYTSDQRFQTIHLENSDDWTLQVKYPQKKDGGVYECQVSTVPKMSLFVTMNVIEPTYGGELSFIPANNEKLHPLDWVKPSPDKVSREYVSKAKIIGGPTLYINSGSTINLTCVVMESPVPPDYVFWYHNGRVINYDSPRGISVHTEKALRTTSKLLISNAQPNDSGNYSCVPSNAEPADIILHVLNGENPAAMQHGKHLSSSSGLPASRNNLILVLCFLLCLYDKR